VPEVESRHFQLNRGQFLIATCTLAIMRRQTSYLEGQIGIQQRSSRQWVNIIQWHQHTVGGGSDRIEIAFQIENPTTNPLRLDVITSKASGQSNDSGLATFLAPFNPFQSELYVSLDSQMMSHYQQGDLVLEVEVSVFFTDAFDNQCNQIFKRILVCGQQNNTLLVRESHTRMRRSGPNDPPED